MTRLSGVTAWGRRYGGWASGLVEVMAQEEQGRRRAAYDAAVTERDAVAKELQAEYAALSERLAELAVRIAANDAEIERVNRGLPDGAPWIASAKMIARGLAGFNDGTAAVPRITQQMRLPAFKYSGHHPYTWPRA